MSEPPATLIEGMVEKVVDALASAPWGSIVGPPIYGLFLHQEQTGLAVLAIPLYDYSRQRILKRVGQPGLIPADSEDWSGVRA